MTESTYATQPLPPASEPPTSPPPAPRRRRPGASLVALALASALVGGGAGAAVNNALDDSPSPTAAATDTASGANGVARGTTATDTTADSPSGSVTTVAAKVVPSVVSIAVSGQSGSGVGTGFLIDNQGHVVTNNHVVAEASGGGSVRVTFPDGRQRTATVVGQDAVSDLAVIKVNDVAGERVVTLGRSAGLAVGDPVVAVGSPLGLSGTVTSGIVSALDRPVSTGSSGQNGTDTTSTVLNAVQTDAAINPGNSGGPLVNMRGEVVGINSAIASLGSDSGGTSGSIGLGFSIPIDQAKPIIDQLITSGKAQHAYLGVQVADAAGATSGARLGPVTAGGAAAKAGLKAGDLVNAIGNRPVESADALVAAVRSHRPGDAVSIRYTRGGATRTTTATLGTAPY
ncbi:MAG: trypsin-like peptidase domain-containing protein [Frankiaceae bacterium]